MIGEHLQISPPLGWGDWVGGIGLGGLGWVEGAAGTLQHKLTPMELVPFLASPWPLRDPFGHQIRWGLMSLMSKGDSYAKSIGKLVLADIWLWVKANGTILE